MPGAAEACAGAVWAWDSYNVLLCAVVTLGMQGVFFCVAAALRFDKVLPRQHPESPTRWQPTCVRFVCQRPDVAPSRTVRVRVWGGVAQVTDVAGGGNFMVLAVLSLALGGTYYLRQILVSAAVFIWVGLPCCPACS